jgi:predicted alpha/beta hydrolase family esterase
MAKRVVIIHGFQGEPMHGFRPWLKRELEARGFEVAVPAMPSPNAPKVEDWVSAIGLEVGSRGEDCILVGHSLGCIAILRYLEKTKKKVAGAVLVAGFASGLGEEFDILRGFLEPQLDFAKVREICPRMTAIFSDNDPYVPLEQAKIFEEKLRAKTVVLHARGHFSSSDGAVDLPEALREVQIIAGWEK